MSPDSRQKLHQLFDQMLDVIEEEQRSEPRKRKAREIKVAKIPLDRATVERALTSCRKAGLL